MIKKILILIIFIIVFLFSFNSTEAQQGCCSWHGGVSHCDTSTGSYVCNDGTYSPTCGCSYIPRQYTTPTFPSEMTAEWVYSPNPSPNNTYNLTITLSDSDPTQYSAVLSKCKGCDPGPLTDFYSKEFNFKDVASGKWYLNVKKSIDGIWSNVVYWTVDVPAWIEPTPTPTKPPIIIQENKNTTDTIDNFDLKILFWGALILLIISLIIIFKDYFIEFFNYLKNNDLIDPLIWITLFIVGIYYYFFFRKPETANTTDTTSNTNNLIDCDCSKTCDEMSSCKEAYYQLNECGCSIRDGDDDGIPCENLCN